MAIITNIITERGYVYNQQYVNIYDINIKKTIMTVNVGIYESQQHYLDGIPPHRIDTIDCVEFDLYSEQNVWQQAYIAIKTQWPDSDDLY